MSRTSSKNAPAQTNNNNNNKKFTFNFTNNSNNEQDEGNFENGDKVKTILKEKVNSEGKLQLEIQWQKRSDGVIPKNSVIVSNIVKKYCPDLLAQYLQDRLMEMELIPSIQSKSTINNQENQNSPKDDEDDSIDKNIHIKKKVKFNKQKKQPVVQLDSEFIDDDDDEIDDSP